MAAKSAAGFTDSLLLQVWGALSAAALAVAVCLTLFSARRPPPRELLTRNAVCTWALLLGQGSVRCSLGHCYVALTVHCSADNLYSSKGSVLLVAGSWSLAAIVVANGYKGMLMSCIYNPIYEPVAHSWDNLARSDRLQVVVPKDTFLAQLYLVRGEVVLVKQDPSSHSKHFYVYLLVGYLLVTLGRHLLGS